MLFGIFWNVAAKQTTAAGNPKDLTPMNAQTIAIHLPDGSIREVPAGTTPLEIANSISPRLAAASVVARLTPLSGAK
jgi:threonyl-tRNA synthetase